MTVLNFSQELLWDFLSRETVSISILEKSGFSGWSWATFWPPSSRVASWNWRTIKTQKRRNNRVLAVLLNLSIS